MISGSPGGKTTTCVPPQRTSLCFLCSEVNTYSCFPCMACAVSAAHYGVRFKALSVKP